MEKVTYQGIRDLNHLGHNKKNLNGRKDKNSENCFHVFEDYIDEDGVRFSRCQRCNFEDTR